MDSKPFEQQRSETTALSRCYRKRLAIAVLWCRGHVRYGTQTMLILPGCKKSRCFESFPGFLSRESTASHGKYSHKVHYGTDSLWYHTRSPQAIERLEPRPIRLDLLLKAHPPHLLQAHMPIKRKMIAVPIQRFRLEHPTALPTPLFQNVSMPLDILTRLQRVLIVAKWTHALEAEVFRDSRPALAHARRAGLVCDVEQLAPAALLRVEGGPDGEFSDDVRGRVIEEGIVASWCPGEGDLCAFPFDRSVEREKSSPVGQEVESAAVGHEADLSTKRHLYQNDAVCYRGM